MGKKKTLCPFPTTTPAKYITVVVTKKPSNILHGNTTKCQKMAHYTIESGAQFLRLRNLHLTNIELPFRRAH